MEAEQTGQVSKNCWMKTQWQVMSNPPTRKSLSRNTLVTLTSILFFVGLSALFLIIGSTIWLGFRSQAYFSEIVEVRDFRSSVVELRSAVQAAETSQRGFLLTGNEIYLAPYGTEKILARRNVDQLSRVIPDSSPRATTFERLKAAVDQKFAEMDSTIDLKRARRDSEALAIIKTNKGKRLTDETNVYFSGLVTFADQRLAAASDEQNKNYELLQFISLVGGIVILLVTGAAAVMVLRYTRAIAESRDEVNVLNASLERRVQERTAHLAQLNEEVRRFAYIVTHDLRAPLVNIMGFTKEVEDSVRTIAPVIELANGSAPANIGKAQLEDSLLALRADIPEAIGFIKSSTQKMDALINAILKLSREGQRRRNIESLDLMIVLESSISAVRHSLSRDDGRVDFHLDVSHIVSDRLSLEQIFGNLFENAVKYRSRERPLRISVTTRPHSVDRVIIEIADNGRGIAEQDLERVFELFRRSGVQDQSGEGIGLAHVRTLVRNLEGDITLASRLGYGTTFSIEFPGVLAEREPESQ